MRPSFCAVLGVLVVWIGAVAPAGEVRPEPKLEALKDHVATLASPDFAGRRGEGARKAEAYIVEHLRELGLEPLFDGSFTQDIPGREPGEVVGRNIGARINGSDPDLVDEWVILSAHYDHLGIREGVLYPGADDNASGVAMLLEAARCLADDESAGRGPRRGVMLVAFDLEEDGLFGSRHFVAHPPVPLEQIKLFLTADLIAGSLGGVCDEYAFVMGSESAPELRPWLEESAGGKPLKLAMMGSDVLLIDRSDYGPFRLRRIPYLFFSTGESPRYHTPRDVPESLDYAKLQSVSQVMLDIVRRAVAADTLPGWSETSEPPLAEMVAVRDVLKRLLEHQDDLKIKAAPLALMKATLPQLDAIIERGSITPTERTRIVRVAQVVLFTVL